MPRLWKYLAISATTIGIFVVLGLIGQRVADGPIGPIAGGKLRTGELVSEHNFDWTFAHRKEIELELVAMSTSRTVVAFSYDGLLYVPVTLGYFTRRIQDYPMIGHVFLYFKRWHLDAMRDGSVVLRIDGKRYLRQAVRVTDPDLIAVLARIVEAAVAEVATQPLIEVQEDSPKGIWFFRMDPKRPE